MEIKANRKFVKVVLKMMGRKKREVLAKLSKSDFIAQVRSNPKSKNLSDEMVIVMYEELIKKTGK